MKNLYLLAFVALALAACVTPPPPTPQPTPQNPPTAPPSPAPAMSARLAAIAKTIGKPATFANTKLTADEVVCGEVSIEGAAPRRFYSTGIGIVYHTGPRVDNLFKSVCGS